LTSLGVAFVTKSLCGHAAFLRNKFHFRHISTGWDQSGSTLERQFHSGLFESEGRERSLLSDGWL
jgi:hypothetical protein